MAASSLSCPHCGQLDSVRKVSAIVSSGTSSGSYTGYGDGIGYSSGGVMIMDELITLTGSSQTQLSSLLSPPIEPCEPNFELVLVCSALLGLFGFFVTMLGLGDISNNTPDATGALILGLICLSIAVLVAVKYFHKSRDEKIRVAREMPVWERAVSKWQHLYYCYRCDGVFLPSLNYIVPTQYMMNFLYYDDARQDFSGFSSE